MDEAERYILLWECDCHISVSKSEELTYAELVVNHLCAGVFTGGGGVQGGVDYGWVKIFGRHHMLMSGIFFSFELEG